MVKYEDTYSPVVSSVLPSAPRLASFCVPREDRDQVRWPCAPPPPASTASVDSEG